MAAVRAFYPSEPKKGEQLPPKLATAKGWVPGQATRRADEPLLTDAVR